MALVRVSTLEFKSVFQERRVVGAQQQCKSTEETSDKAKCRKECTLWSVFTYLTS